MADQIKCVIVGDGAVGKTCMLSVISTKTFPQEYVTDMHGNYSADLLVDNKPACLGLQDTQGQEDYDRLRPMYYLQTDIFVVVFSVVSPPSLENTVAKWVPEISHHCPEAPFMLVGNMTDLRGSEEVVENLEKHRMTPVTKLDGEKCARQLGAVGYMECSAFTQDGLTEVFEAVVRVVRETPSRPKEAPSKCLVL